jgi:hypothetical protein|tara:strand:+ start:562 stop:795 length:234 start_codon:yes stop_codon:yes gene_type:complete
MGNKYNHPGESAASAAAPNPDDRQRHGFMRAVARELLVYNPDIQGIDQAITLAEEFTNKVWEDDHHTGHPKENAKSK